MKSFSLSIIKILFLFILAAVFNPVQAADSQTHIVEKGETFLEIALNYGVSSEQLQTANPQIDPVLLLVGDELIIPPGDEEGFNSFLQEMYAQYLEIDDSVCYAAADESINCYFHIHNISQVVLYNVRSRVSLSDAGGQQKIIELLSPINQLLPDERIPLLVNFYGPFSEPISTTTAIIGLDVSSASSSAMRLLAQDYSITYEITPDGLCSQVQFSFSAERKADNELNLLAAAYNDEGKLIGLRTWNGDFAASKTLMLYSDAEMIHEIKSWAEVF